jgi:hypothetical protein
MRSRAHCYEEGCSRGAFPFSEFRPTIQLTHDAESECSRRLSFSAVLATTCDDLSVGESSLFVAHVRRCGQKSRTARKFIGKLGLKEFMGRDLGRRELFVDEKSTLAGREYVISACGERCGDRSGNTNCDCYAACLW